MDVRQVGVEEEFLLLRSDAARLAAQGDAVVDAASDADGDAQFEHELKQAQAELASSPARSLDSLSADLRALRSQLATAAGARQVRVVPSGTSPIRGPATTTAEHRYQQMTEQFGLIGRQQLTCGTHIHVSVDPDEGVRVLDGLAPWLSLLTALSANSPFYAGEDTGYASYRSMLWGQWPTAGPVGAFGDRDSYESLRTSLIAVGAARDDGMIYFDARLSRNYPTVEIRVCDVCIDPADAVVIAGLARALVHWCAGAAAEPGACGGIRTELLRAASWRAARWGMGGELVDLIGAPSGPRLVGAWDLVDTMLERLGPALESAGDLDVVTKGLDRIRHHGTGAAVQRALHDGHQDAKDFTTVLDALALDPGGR